jgi:spoIIIJ-associated protein
MSEQQDSKSVNWLSKLLVLQGLNAKVSGHRETDDSGDSSYWLTIEDEHLSAQQVEGLLGPKGAVLDSVQYLANTILNLGQDPEAQQSYTVELAGYRQRRQAELKAMADAAAQHAMETGKEYEICDLSSAERRQMHNFLKGYDGLETFSRGKEPDRRLIVRLVED